MSEIPARRALFIKLQPSWFAGVSAGELNSEQCLSERSFYNGLGFAVLMTAVVSSLTLLVSLGYVLHRPVTQLWPIALIWFAVIANVDRLLQMVVASKRMWFGVIPRVLVTLVLGVLISEPLLVAINGPEIGRALTAQTQTAVQNSTQSIESFYLPKVVTAQSQITATQQHENSLREAVVQDSFISSCEATEANCSLTHRLGCGPVCNHYQQLAQVSETELRATLPVDDAAIERLREQITTLTDDERRALASGRASIERGSGFIAREEVLDGLMSKNAPVFYEVWLLRLAFWLLDLLPLILKYLHIASGSAAFERVIAARRRQEAARAHGVDAETKVEHARVNDQADADIEANRIRIWAERDRRCRESDDTYGWGGSRTPSSTPRSITAVSLSDLAGGGSMTHEAQPVDVPPALRRAGWLGVTLVASLAGALTLLSVTAGVAVAGTALVDVAVVTEFAIAAYTRGFKRANRWALRATFASLVTSLTLPIVLAVLNL